MNNQITKIYLVTNCYGDPNKVYIGKTVTTRKNHHKRTYGNDITYDYIDEVESLDKDVWVPIESFWIEYFRQLGFDLQNKNKGGGGSSFFTEEQKQKLRGRVVSQSTIDKLTGRKFSKEVCLRISQGKMGLSQDVKDRISKGNKGKSKNKGSQRLDKSKPVLQYDLKGNFIKEWPSAKSAELEFNPKSHRDNISSCCRKEQKTSYNFIWKYK
jgi:hypothetical protein